MGNPEQPRDERGRWTSGGGGGLDHWAEHMAKQVAPRFVTQIEKRGGFTYRPDAPSGQRVPKRGIMVSRDPKEGHGHVVEVAKIVAKAAEGGKSAREVRDEARREVLKAAEEWLKRSLPAMKKLGKDHYLGGWAEKKEGSTVAIHFDISQRFSSRHKKEALRAGRERNQLAVWHIDKGEEIATGGTGR